MKDKTAICRTAEIGDFSCTDVNDQDTESQHIPRNFTVLGHNHNFMKNETIPVAIQPKDHCHFQMKAFETRSLASNSL